MLTKEPSKIGSIISCKCPRCRKGKVFPYSPFNLLKFSVTNDYCPVCNLKFEHETGFFWGAMYISYSFSTAIMIASGVIFINLEWSLTRIIQILIPTILLLTPFSYRYSRILLLYLISPNRHYKKDWE